jgi:hypothetical protein
MSGGLLPETVAALKGVKARAPLFSNMIAAELFDYAHTLGPLKVLPRTDGKLVIVDIRLPVGGRTLSTHSSVEEADKAMRAGS